MRNVKSKAWDWDENNHDKIFWNKDAYILLAITNLPESSWKKYREIHDR